MWVVELKSLDDIFLFKTVPVAKRYDCRSHINIHLFTDLGSAGSNPKCCSNLHTGEVGLSCVRTHWLVRKGRPNQDLVRDSVIRYDGV